MSWLPSIEKIKSVIFPRRSSHPKPRSILEPTTSTGSGGGLSAVQSKVISGRIDKQIRYKHRDLLLKQARYASSSSSVSSSDKPSTYASDQRRKNLDESEASSVKSDSSARLKAEDVRQLQLLQEENTRMIQTHIANGWSADEIWLFEKLNRRGQEPLMPELWQWDFPSYPDDIFTVRIERAFIKNLTTPVTEGQSPMNAFFKIICADPYRF